LIKFLVEEWKKTKYQRMLQDEILFATQDEVYYKIVKENWKEVRELKSTQEEADKRISFCIHFMQQMKDTRQLLLLLMILMFL